MMTSGLARGIPIIEISRRLGHKSIEFHPQDLSPPRAQFLGRGRTALDDAYEENQRQQPPGEQIDEGTNQIQRMVMARQLLKG
jgi:hypothetical protein